MPAFILDRHARLESRYPGMDAEDRAFILGTTKNYADKLGSLGGRTEQNPPGMREIIREQSRRWYEKKKAGLSAMDK